MTNDVAREHQLRVARATLKMSDIIVRVMGGMTKDEARRVLREEREEKGTNR